MKYLLLFIPIIGLAQYNESDAELNFEKQHGPKADTDVSADKYNELRDSALYYFKTKEKLHHELSESRAKADEAESKKETAKTEEAPQEDSYYEKRSESKQEELKRGPKQPETKLQKEARLKREAAIVRVRCNVDANDCNKTYGEL